MREKEVLGRTVKRFRQFKGLTQKDLAKKVGLTSDTISKLERGEQENIGFKYLTLISRELDVSLEELHMQDPKVVCIRFVVSDNNLRSMENLLDKIISISGKKE